jgi:hypothetical protein
MEHLKPSMSRCEVVKSSLLLIVLLLQVLDLRERFSREAWDVVFWQDLDSNRHQKRDDYTAREAPVGIAHIPFSLLPRSRILLIRK